MSPTKTQAKNISNIAFRLVRCYFHKGREPLLPDPIRHTLRVGHFAIDKAKHGSPLYLIPDFAVGLH